MTQPLISPRVITSDESAARLFTWAHEGELLGLDLRKVVTYRVVLENDKCIVVLEGPTCTEIKGKANIAEFFASIGSSKNHKGTGQGTAVIAEFYKAVTKEDS